MVWENANPSGLAAQPMAPYARIKEFLKEGLAKEKWLPGALMPSEAELAAQFGVSRVTATRALRELQSEGLVNRLQGVGTFAAHLFRVSSTLSIRDLHDEISSRGHRHHAEVHVAKLERAPAGLGADFCRAVGTAVFHTLIVHFENDVPLQSEDRYVNPACAPDYLKTDFTQITPTQYLLKVAPLWEAQYSIEACAPSEQEARLLRIRRSEPCLVVVRGTERGGVPITLARLVHPGSRYMLRGEFKP